MDLREVIQNDVIKLILQGSVHLVIVSGGKNNRQTFPTI